MLKKTALAILSLGFSSFVQAGTMGPNCTPGNVTVPCETRLWELGVQALYLKPVYSSDFGYVSTLSTTTYHERDPDWGWGYRLLAAYHFDTGNDISAYWTHYDVSSDLGTYSGQFLFGIPRAANAQNTLENTYDQVNLVFGQFVDISLRKKARFFAGLQYASMRADAVSLYALDPSFIAGTGGSVRDFNNTDFKGLGPVIGIDYAYALSSHFSITANTAGSLLYGTSRMNFATNYGNGLVAVFAYGTQKKVVPGLEAKLGANYAYEMVHGLLNIEAGYQTINYFSPYQSRSLTGTLATSNFGLYGPYFGVKWLGAA